MSIFVQVDGVMIELEGVELEKYLADAALNEQTEYELALIRINSQRRVGYQTFSDPIFFQYQRGEKTEQEWLDAVQAINDANPYPVKAGK